MNHTHIKSGGVYEVRHIANWLPGGTPVDGEDLLVMREKLTGEVAVQRATNTIPTNYDVILGARLQVATETNLTGSATMVVYANAQGEHYGRELAEFNAGFEPPLDASTAVEKFVGTGSVAETPAEAPAPSPAPKSRWGIGSGDTDA